MFRGEGKGSMILNLQSRSLGYMISCMAGVAPMYSASVDESATIDWSLLLHETVPPFIIHMKPDVDHLVSTHPAQSESQKPSIRPSISFIPTPYE